MDKQTLIKMYKSGELGPEEKKLMEQYIHEGIIALDEIEDLNEVHESVGKLAVPEPTDHLRSAVHQAIAQEKQRLEGPGLVAGLEAWLARFMSSSNHQLAYTLGLLLIGIVVGRFFLPSSNQSELSSLHTEVKEMKEMMMINMLEDVSVSERLKAVSFGNELGADEKVIGALLNTLNNDENVNVRLASLEALGKYVQNATVRQGLVGSIKHQTSPMVQVSLAELIVAMQDVEAARDFKALLDQQEVIPEVKENIVKNLEQII
jgi:hypothetical protein